MPELKKLLIVASGRDPKTIRDLLLKHRAFIALLPKRSSEAAEALKEARIVVKDVPETADALMAALGHGNHAWILEASALDRAKSEAVKKIATATGVPIIEI